MSMTILQHTESVNANINKVWWEDPAHFSTLDYDEAKLAPKKYNKTRSRKLWKRLSLNTNGELRKYDRLHYLFQCQRTHRIENKQAQRSWSNGCSRPIKFHRGWNYTRTSLVLGAFNKKPSEQQKAWNPSKLYWKIMTHRSWSLKTLPNLKMPA